MLPISDRAIFLVGPMGAGKSTIGRLLAARLHVRLIDLDERIVDQAGCTIPEVFAQRGEHVFRDMESEALKAIDIEGASVVATGGGIVLREGNRKFLRANGHTVWLDAAPEVLAERVRGDRNRPLMQGVDPLQKARELDAVRRPLYEEVASLRIDTAELSAHEAVDAICAFLSESGHE